MAAHPAAKTLPTDEELMALPKDGNKYELVDGEIVMTPAGCEHGFECADLIITLGSYVRANKLGRICDGQTGIKLATGDVLSPDVSFISTARLPDLTVRGNFYQGVPDLVVEVLSPSEPKKHIARKLSLYLSNQGRLVWLIDSRKRTVTVHRIDGSSQTLSEDETLSGEEVVPGFSIPVASLFVDNNR